MNNRVHQKTSSATTVAEAPRVSSHMRLYSYVVARDYSFAPNPFFGVCTLATCKPSIRQSATVGDLVVGSGSKSRGQGRQLVFAMSVTGIMSFNDILACGTVPVQETESGGKPETSIR